MGIQYEQTDNSAACGALPISDGPGVAVSPAPREMEDGGTAGVVEAFAEILPDETSIAYVFESKIGTPNLTTWPAGNWIVPLNVNSTNSDLVWQSTYICKVSSGCVLTVLGFLEDQDITNLGPTSSMTVNVSSDSTVLATDRVYIAIGIGNNSSAGNRTIGIIPNRGISTPIPAGGSNQILVLAASAGVSVSGPLTILLDAVLNLVASVGVGVSGPLVITADRTLDLAASVGTSVSGPLTIIESGILVLAASVGTSVSGPLTISGGAAILKIWDGANMIPIGGTT